LAVGDGGVLMVKCHAPHGCTFSSIADGVRLPRQAFFPDYQEKSPEKKNDSYMSGKISATYDYRDEQNVLLFQAIRFDPKDFRQRRHNPAVDYSMAFSKDNPEHIWNLEGVRRVLYRLPELLMLLKAKPERWVLILEGEKDVDTAMKHGLTATCNPMGAGKWDKSYSEMLRGCNLVVIPDEDSMDDKGNSPGCKHAEDVCNTSLGIAKSVRAIRLPGVGPKGDFTEWWINQEQAKVSVDDRKKAILEMIRLAPPWTRESKIIPVAHAVTHAVAQPSTKEPAKESSWDGEITPGLERIADIAVDLRKNVPIANLSQLIARIQIEVAHAVSAVTLSEKQDDRYLRETLGAIGAYAVRGLEELGKVKVAT
jgi:hypothetical protein